MVGQQVRSGCDEAMTALEQACINRDIATVDLLLRHGARDDDSRALAVVVTNKDDILTAKLLSIKVKWHMTVWPDTYCTFLATQTLKVFGLIDKLPPTQHVLHNLLLVLGI